MLGITLLKVVIGTMFYLAVGLYIARETMSDVLWATKITWIKKSIIWGLMTILSPIVYSIAFAILAMPILLFDEDPDG